MRRLLCALALALLPGLSVAAQNAPSNAEADLNRWAEAQERRVGYADLLPSPVPKGRKVVWSLDVRRGDIYGMTANRIVFWLDDHGGAWVRDYEPRLESLSSQFLRLKDEHPKAADQELDHWLVLEDRWGDGASLASLHLQEVLRLWSKIPPASDTDYGVFFEADVWTGFEVQGALKPASGDFSVYAEKLGAALPEAGALSREALKEPHGAFIGAGAWIQQVRDSLFNAWQETHARDDFRSVISNSELKTRGLALLSSACARAYEPLALALIKRGVPPDQGTESAGYPFSYACGTGRVEFVQSLLRAGANPNLPSEVSDPDSAQRPPLWEAACAGDIETVKLLLKHGAKTHIKGYSLLADVRNAQRNAQMVESGAPDPYPAIINLLVEAGAKE